MELLKTEIIRQGLVLTSAKLLIVFIVLTLVSCPFLALQDVVVVAWGFIDLAVAVVLYYFLVSTSCAQLGPYFVLGLSYLAVLPLILLTGGVSSHFVYLIPVAPLMAGLLMQYREAIGVSAALVVTVLVLAFNHARLNEIAGLQIPHDETLLRAYWLIMATVIATVFVYFYDQSNGALKSRLQELAYNDPLTGIANRRSLLQALEHAIGHAQQRNDWLSVIMIDMDDFKQLNDTHGHAAGDVALQRTAALLSQSVRRGQDVVGRLGGEEFLVVLPGVSPRHIGRIAETVRAALANLALPEGTGRVSATIGACSLCGKQLESALQLIGLADQALYRGKAQGKNRVVVMEQSLA